MQFVKFLMTLSSIFLLSLPSSWAQTEKLSQAEKHYLESSPYALQYPNEHLPIIEVENTVELGKLAALSFLEWVQENPHGVIALPSGKTPEYFIKFITYYKKHWASPSVQQELQKYGIQSKQFPDTSHLKFVQLDEFYGIPSNHQRSFRQYVETFYVKTLNLKPENVLLIDLSQQGTLAKYGYDTIFPNNQIDFSLLERSPVNKSERRQKQALKEVLAYCDTYEKKIHDWGGIGFFLGGIGLDGHIAFNLPGVDPHAPTHFAQLNYETSAQSAVDLGGIENARDRGVMTIGFETLRSNPNAKIIIMAAGEVKAPIIKQTVEGASTNQVPASLLQKFTHATLFLTKGASSQLSARKAQNIQDDADSVLKKSVIIETALKHQKTLRDLTVADFQDSIEGQALIKSVSDLKGMLSQVEKSLKDNIQRGLEPFEHKTFLHTAPHHDDVMLSYYPMMHPLLHRNQNYFAYLTSGFNSVTDGYLIQAIDTLKTLSPEKIKSDILNTDYKSLLAEFSQAYERGDKQKVAQLEPFFVYHKIKEAFFLKSVNSFQKKAAHIKQTLVKKTPGNPDITPIQLLKGMIRESEADRLWAMNHVQPDHIKHLRSKFYTGAIFDPIPNIKDDAKPMMGLYQQYNPEVITVALDPEGTGPDTHYKVLQVVAQSLKLTDSMAPQVWGYRNVWHRFDYTDANVFYPVQFKQILEQDSAFLNAFATQKTAAFPSPQHDGPFSEISAQIQRKQLNELKVLLGQRYFDEHPSPLVRNASGFVLIKQMPKHEFIVYADDLKKKTQLDLNHFG